MEARRADELGSHGPPDASRSVSLRGRMAEPWLELDAVLRGRLREVLGQPPPPLTESELRSLLEEGRACMLILGGELDRLEGRLAQLDRSEERRVGKERRPAER